MGRRQATATAAACLAAVAVFAALPQSAAAFACDDKVPAKRTLQLAGTDECRAPGTVEGTAPARVKKKATVSGLTVFVLAIAGALLIPIGRRGLPQGSDPYAHDPIREPF